MHRHFTRNSAVRAFLLPSLLLIAATLSGCASSSYTSTAPRNMTLRPDLEGGGLFTSRDTEVGIYRMGGKCPAEYLGSVDLDNEPVEIGLETGRPLYLKFTFMQGGSHGSSTMIWGVPLTPRPGAQYLAKVRWRDDMYEARVQEIGKGGAVVREFGRQNFPCPEE